VQKSIHCHHEDLRVREEEIWLPQVQIEKGQTADHGCSGDYVQEKLRYDRALIELLEVVSKPWITPAGKAQADSKAEEP
jgi:hypothetical protein